MTHLHIKKIGLTGNIGTGKSTVAWMFSEMGVPVLYADDIARDALAPNAPAWKAVFERYGAGILGADRQIDRRELGRIVFQSPAERTFLESLIHPHVRVELERALAEIARKGNAFAIAEIPLLFEAGFAEEMDAIVVVRCNEEQEIERCMEKFGWSRDEVLLRIAAQLPLAKKVEKADAVIDNDGPLDETRVQVHRLYQEMVKGRFPKARDA
jgi:dephospho-CoA kinase